MKKITTCLTAVAIGCFLALASPVMGQEANRNNTELVDDDDDTDYGWVGLIGLLGLLGLRKRDKVVDRDYTTTTRPTGTTNR